MIGKKKVPETVLSEAVKLIQGCRQGNGERLLSRAKDLQNRFDKLAETCWEAKEMCEEATADMQVHVHVYTCIIHVPCLFYDVYIHVYFVTLQFEY